MTISFPPFTPIACSPQQSSPRRERKHRAKRSFSIVFLRHQTLAVNGNPRGTMEGDPNPKPEMAKHLASIFGTEKDPDKLQEHFDDFYKDLFEELNKYGQIQSLSICDNLADHLVGNVYVQYKEEDHAANALMNLIGRFYLGEVHSSGVLNCCSLNPCSWLSWGWTWLSRGIGGSKVKLCSALHHNGSSPKLVVLTIDDNAPVAQVGSHFGWRYAFWVEAILMLPFAILGFVMKHLQMKFARNSETGWCGSQNY